MATPSAHGAALRFCACADLQHPFPSSPYLTVRGYGTVPNKPGYGQRYRVHIHILAEIRNSVYLSIVCRTAKPTFLLRLLPHCADNKAAAWRPIHAAFLLTARRLLREGDLSWVALNSDVTPVKSRTTH
jgi:hypothetical protein